MKRETTNSRPAPATSETATHKPVGAGAGISTGQAQQKRYSTASNGGNPSGEIVTGKDAQPRTMRGMDTHNKSDGIESVPASAGVYDQTDCACPEPISTNGLRLMAAATRANRARLAMYQMEQEAK